MLVLLDAIIAVAHKIAILVRLEMSSSIIIAVVRRNTSLKKAAKKTVYPVQSHATIAAI